MGRTWAEHEAASHRFWAQLDPMDGLNLTWELSREWGLMNGIDVDGLQIRGSPVTLHLARRPVPVGRRSRSRKDARRDSPLND